VIEKKNDERTPLISSTSQRNGEGGKGHLIIFFFELEIGYTITTIATIRLQEHVAQPKSKERKKEGKENSVSPSHVSMLSIPRI
jgi:hypothetical protein